MRVYRRECIYTHVDLHITVALYLNAYIYMHIFHTYLNEIVLKNPHSSSSYFFSLNNIS